MHALVLTCEILLKINFNLSFVGRSRVDLLNNKPESKKKKFNT